MTLLLLALSAAYAGYADVDADGLPHWVDRELHLYTNAARVDPEAFEADYNSGGCSYYTDFSTDEQTPKPPLYYDRNLNAAAVFHSTDMETSGDFSHDSSDGTPFATRLAQYYPDSGYVGENIAEGYGGSYNTVFVGWMCSHAGHRANIMSGDYNELGTSVVDDYATQDFGAGTVDTDSPVAMGMHEPETPTDTVTFYADWQDSAAPATLEVVLDGQASGLSLEWGTDIQGVYALDLPVDDPATCHQYYILWTRADGSTGTFPETGSYLFGSSCADAVGWVDGQMCITGQTCRTSTDLAKDIDLVGCGCAQGGEGGGWAGWVAGALALAVRMRRRRRSSICDDA